MKITAYDIADSPQARDFVSGVGSGSTPTITSVKVNGVAVAFSGNGVIVSGLHAGDQIQAAGSEIMHLFVFWAERRGLPVLESIHGAFMVEGAATDSEDISRNQLGVSG
jgi:hypothetical protein